MTVKEMMDEIASGCRSYIADPFFTYMLDGKECLGCRLQMKSVIRNPEHMRGIDQKCLVAEVVKESITFAEFQKLP